MPILQDGASSSCQAFQERDGRTGRAAGVDEAAGLRSTTTVTRARSTRSRSELDDGDDNSAPGVPTAGDALRRKAAQTAAGGDAVLDPPSLANRAQP